MKKPGTVTADEWAAFKDQAKGLERDYIGEIIKSRSTWKRLAFVSMGATVMSVAAVMLLTPLKTAEAVVVRVDKSTGFVDVVSKLADQTPTQGEEVDKYFLTRYVQSRESYDYNTIQVDYNRTALLSRPNVQLDYFKLYQGDQARDKVLKNLYRINTTIKSVTLNKELGTGVVRFYTEQVGQGGSAERPDRQDWIATIGYEYVNAPMKESDRRENPLGFQITSYRVDAEVVGQ